MTDDNDLPQDEDGIDEPVDEEIDEEQEQEQGYFVPGPVHRQPPVAAQPVMPAQPKRQRAGRRAGVGAAPAASAQPQRIQHGRPRGKVGHLPNTTFESREVELLWPEIIDWLKANGKTPYDVSIRVIRVEPPPREVFVKTFDGAAVQGSQTMLAADAFIDFVARYYHMGSSLQGPALYHFMFMWKASGQLFASGELRLPSQADLLNQYQMSQSMPAQQRNLPPGQLPPYGVGGMPPPNQQQPQQPLPPMQGYGYQPTYQNPAMPQAPAASPPHENEAIWQLRQEIKLLREKQDLEDRAARQPQRFQQPGQQRGFGRPAGYPQQPGYPPAEAQPASTEEIVARTVRAVLESMGVGPAGGRQPGAPPGQEQPPPGFGYRPPWQPPAVTAQDAAATASTGVGSLKQLVQTAKELREVGLAIDRVFGRGEEEAQETGVAAAPAEVEPADPGFEVADVGPDVKWRDGRPVKIARDKNGNIDWMGVGLANPMITETIVEKFGNIMQSMGERMRPGVGQPPMEEQQFQQPPQLHGGQPTAADFYGQQQQQQPIVEEQPAEETQTNGAVVGGFNLS
jgi:hypothetical protein